MEFEVPAAVAAHIAEQDQQIELLKAKVDHLNEIIAVYRDALQSVQSDFHLRGALNTADLKAIAKQGGQQ